jgi:hypothetical protein
MCVRGGGGGIAQKSWGKGGRGWGEEGWEGEVKHRSPLLLSVYLPRNLEKHKLVTYLALLAVRGCMHVQTVQFPQGLFTFK